MLFKRVSSSDFCCLYTKEGQVLRSSGFSFTVVLTKGDLRGFLLGKVWREDHTERITQRGSKTSNGR